MDFRKLGIEKAFANLLKKDFTEEDKQYLRINKDIIGNEYLVIKRSKQPAKYAYPKEQQEAINKFIQENGFKEIEIEPEKPDYKIELVATPKAEKEVERMIKTIIANSNNRVLAKSAKTLANIK